MGLSPTAGLFRKRKGRLAKWNEWDYLLNEAVDQLEAERCYCGLPVYVCHSDDPHIRFRIDEDVCEATKAKEVHEEREQKAGGENYRKPPGSGLRPVPYTTDGSDFSQYRDDYYQSERERLLEALPSAEDS